MHKAYWLQIMNSNLLLISSSLLCALHPPNVLLVFHFPLSWLSIIFHVTLVCSEQPHKTSWQGLLLHITLGDPSALGSFPAVRTHLVIFFFALYQLLYLDCVLLKVGTPLISGIFILPCSNFLLT